MANLAMNERIGIVGAGLIGRAWAIVFARAGCNVVIHDSAPEALAACRMLLRDSVSDLAQHDLISETPDTVLGRITPATTLTEALQGAALVQENVRETLEAKQAIFAEMDRLAEPETILASSTSWIPASLFSAALEGRGRIIVGHPVNPSHLVPLVRHISDLSVGADGGCLFFGSPRPHGLVFGSDQGPEKCRHRAGPARANL
jgi:3-hydroxyacyl-CoA dehydrogenase